MAIIYEWPRLTVHQGTTLAEVFSFRNSDLVTCDDFSAWSATFEVFNVDHEHVLRVNSGGTWLRTGLWNPTGDFAYNCYMEFPPSFTNADELYDQGLCHFDLDLIDPFGHVQYRVQGEIAFERGTTHV